MSTLSKEILLKELGAGDWTVRANAQSQVAQIQKTEDWVEIIEASSVASSTALNIVLRQFCDFLQSTKTSDVLQLFRLATLQAEPFLKNEVHSRHIMEAFLSSRQLSYRSKVQEIVSLFVRVLRDKTFVNRERILVFSLRSFAQFRARQAIIYFDEVAQEASEPILFELIRTMKRTRDPKSAALLEKLFSHSNSRVAALAVDAYGNIGMDFLRAYRLYGSYFSSSQSVKLSILSAVPRIQARIAFWVLKKFYEKESDSVVRYQILKKMALIVRPECAEFLLKVSSQATEVQLRTIASWSFQAMPALEVEKAILKGVQSSDKRMQRTAIAKTSQLPQQSARKILKPLLSRVRNLDPVIRQALTETVGHLPIESWSSDWLLERIGEDPLTTIAAVSGLLQRSQPPIDAILDRVEKNQGHAFESTLSLLAENPHIWGKKMSAERIAAYLSHLSVHARYLSCRYLLRLGEEKYFRRVWELAREENEADQHLFRSILEKALASSRGLIRWVPHHRIENLDSDEKFMSSVFEHLPTVSWSLDNWRSTFITAFPDGAPALQKFCRSNRPLWGDILDRLVVGENDPAILGLLGKVATAQGKKISTETIQTILKKVDSRSYSDTGEVLAFISGIMNPDIGNPFSTWVMGLPAGNLRDQARLALSRWVVRNG